MVTHQQDLKVCEQAGGGTLSLPDRKGEFIKDILSHGNKMSVAGGRRVSDAAVAGLCCLVPLWLSLLSLDTGHWTMSWAWSGAGWVELWFGV